VLPPTPGAKSSCAPCTYKHGIAIPGATGPVAVLSFTTRFGLEQLATGHAPRTSPASRLFAASADADCQGILLVGYPPA
jgi:hypothetical protein